MRRIDLTNQRFGRLLVIAMAGSNSSGRGLQLVRCDCGTEKHVSTRDLTSAGTASCGCLAREIHARLAKTQGPLNGRAGAKKTAASKRVHGHARQRGRSNASPTYRTWQAIKQRCRNPNNPDFKHYGGRGIQMCDRWHASFEAFLSDMGKAPRGRTIDRINNDGNYEPGNCRWATRKEQRANQGRA